MILVGPVMAATGTCYLVSDASGAEMLAFVATIGVDAQAPHPRRAALREPAARRAYVPGASDPGAPHIELTQAERDRAVDAGAHEVSGRELTSRCAGTPPGWRGHLRESPRGG